ncbi:MAG: Fpg/Nei family DNA glycosylase [Candidatus Geothermincolia bacterium]
MPELPDVEVKKNYIARTSLNLKIAGVSALKSRVLRNVTPASLDRDLRGRELVSARRRAKFVLIGTDRGETLLMHFGMTGDAAFRKKGEDEPRFVKVAFRFVGGGTLYYTDPRMFGRIALYDTLDESEIPDVAGLGPEPLDRSFTFKKFAGIVRSRNTTIHQLLMEQDLIAGIGNIFSDEITYQAGVLPYRKTGDLSDPELRLLFDKMKWTLRKAIELDADLDRRADLFLIPHRGKGGECPHGHPLHMKTIGGRSSYYCAVEQK